MGALFSQARACFAANSFAFYHGRQYLDTNKWQQLAAYLLLREFGSLLTRSVAKSFPGKLPLDPG